MSDPENYQYDIDTAEVAELWRRGSVVGGWLLDLTADVLRGNSELVDFTGGVSDSGEGRWTVNAAVDLGVPAPVITTALYQRFDSRGLAAFRVQDSERYALHVWWSPCQIKNELLIHSSVMLYTFSSNLHSNEDCCLDVCCKC